MKKQTAVEWLVANIDWQLLKNTSLHYEMIVNKAKEMEREHHNQTFNESRLTHPMIGFKHETFNEYYTETFEL
jgi:hypothetical protein